jgi:DNA-binding winged helix-turn-helix (wHTH) protein/TolB-like protein/tetratricopeptide (TPR) repeat protein
MGQEPGKSSGLSEPSAHRDRAPPLDRLGFAGYTLDPVGLRLFCGDQEVALRPKSLAVLRYLARHAGRVIPKQELIGAVWPNTFVTDDSLVQCIKDVRQALGDAAKHLIRTMPGRGYLFDGVVEIVAPPVPNAAALPAAPTLRPSTRRSRRFPSRRVLPGLGGAAALGALAIWLLVGVPSAEPPLLSVAVLPFEGLADHDADADLAEALSDGLRTGLTRLPGGMVVARKTSLTYDHPTDVRAIGRALHVRFLLEGSIRREAGLLRVAAKIDDTVTGTQVWAQTFDSDATDRAHGWGDLLARIDISTTRALVTAGAERSWREHPDNPTAVDLQIRGIGLMRRGLVRENFLAAQALFEEALRLDPNSVESMRRLAQIGMALVTNDWTDDREAELARADRLNQATLALAPNDAMVHFTRGLLLRARGQRDQEIVAYERALELNSRFVWAYVGIGRALMEQGQFEDGLRNIETALRLAPNDGDAGAWYFLIGVAQLYLGLDETAVLSFRRAIEINPQETYSHVWFGIACGITGRLAEAQRELAAIRDRDPSFSAIQFMQTGLASAPASVSQRDRLREGLRRASIAQ